MVVVTAIISVKEGKSDEFEKAFHQFQPQALKDPGTITYILHRSVDDPCKFLFYEKYESDDALKYHRSTKHFKDFSQKADPLMKVQPEVSSYQEVV